jgi:hypothetical protein
MASFIDHISFAWTGDFDSLKLLIAEDLKLDGTWEHPGGDKKVFKFNDIVRSRGEKVKVSCRLKATKWVKCINIYVKRF